MKFWIFMLVINLLIPATMIGVGASYRKHPPASINPFSGYRTRRSMASHAAWDYAHRLFGKIWFCVGLVLLPLSVLAMLPLLGKSEDTVGTGGMVICMVQLVPMIVSVIPVELSLAKAFDKDGSRIQK